MRRGDRDAGGAEMRYDGNSLAAIWSAATTRSLHGPGCSCIGAGAITLSPQQLEDDVLDFLLDRYGDDPTLSNALRQRMGDKSTGFILWFEGVQANPALAPQTAHRLRADLIGICQSIVAPDRGLICQ